MIKIGGNEMKRCAMLVVILFFLIGYVVILTPVATYSTGNISVDDIALSNGGIKVSEGDTLSCISQQSGYAVNVYVDGKFIEGDSFAGGLNGQTFYDYSYTVPSPGEGYYWWATYQQIGGGTIEYGNVYFTKKPTVDSVEILMKDSMEKGTSQVLSVKVVGIESPIQDCKWSVIGNTSNKTVIKNGSLFIDIDEAASQIRVKAESVADSDKYSEKTISLVNPIVSRVIISPTTVSMKNGDKQEFTAVVSGPSIISNDVLWSLEGNISENTVLVKNGNVSSLTIGTDETARTIKVIATSKYDYTKKGTANIRLTDQEPSIESVIISEQGARVKKGAEAKFTAIVTGKNNPVSNVLWYVSNNMSTLTRIDENGVLFIGQDESSPYIIVHATSILSPNIEGTATTYIDFDPQNDGTKNQAPNISTGVPPQIDSTNDVIIKSTSASKLTKTYITKIKRLKKSIKVFWKKVRNITGYNIQLATDTKFKKNKKEKIFKSAKTINSIIKKLKKKKRYYIRIRTYVDQSGSKVYSKWSKIKSVKM